MMRLVYPQYLYYGLTCAAALLVFLIWAELRYRRLAETFARSRPLKLIAPFYQLRHPALCSFLILISVVLISIALARPQWGFYLKSEKYKGRDIIFALDLSRSMTSQDAAPDRITHAKDEITNFVRTNGGDRAALIGFSGDAFLFCPLTMNRDTFLRVLDDMHVGSVRRGGTSYYSLIVEAARSFKGAAANDRILVILSDGEDTEGSLGKAIDEAKKEGMTIYSVGVGTPAGGLMPVVDKGAKDTFVKDDKGVPVRTRLDEIALKRLAAETGGAYERGETGAYALEKIKSRWIPKSKEEAKEEVFGRVYKERFQIPLILAFIALAAELFLTMVNRSEKL